MIIYKKDKKLKVTSGASESIFKGLGWSTEPTEEHKEAFHSGMNLSDPDEDELTQDETVHEDEDPASEEDLSERPLSDLSLDELRALAKQYSVNIEGMKLKRDIRSAIREVMSEEN